MSGLLRKNCIFIPLDGDERAPIPQLKLGRNLVSPVVIDEQAELARLRSELLTPAELRIADTLHGPARQKFIALRLSRRARSVVQ